MDDILSAIREHAAEDETRQGETIAAIGKLAERVKGIEFELAKSDDEKVESLQRQLAISEAARAEVERERREEEKERVRDARMAADQLAKEARDDARARRNIWIVAVSLLIVGALSWLAVYTITHLSSTPQRVVENEESYYVVSE